MIYTRLEVLISDQIWHKFNENPDQKSTFSSTRPPFLTKSSSKFENFETPFWHDFRHEITCPRRGFYVKSDQKIARPNVKSDQDLAVARVDFWSDLT